ncbi:MAG: nitrous oxide reductase family maturation protein NosD [Saprospiraceae bacterium]|nr:nitrous oxide reductase family maturation protein NosD [Saprospiraceae bacterium]
MSERMIKYSILGTVILSMGSHFCLIAKVWSYHQSSLDLAAVVSSAQAFDTLIIQEGTYVIDPLIIDKPLTLLGNNYPTLHSKDGDELIVVTADSVNIIGLTFTGVTTSYLKERAAIRIVRSKAFAIEDNKILDCFFGIYLEHAKRGLINNNEIRGTATTEAASGNAIHAWYCDQLTITDNELEGHRDGIYFEFVDQSLIRGNHSHHQLRYGLHFMFSNDDQYLDNNFHHNGAGVAVMFSRRIEMINNRFTYNLGNSSYGLLLKEINDAEVTGNLFDKNTTGIFVEGSNRIKYTKNTFHRNGWAIKFSGGCSANEITYNNFTNNALDMVVSTSLSDNQIHHNYWSDYTGYDLDKNEIGDIPHYPVKLFSYILDLAPEAIVLLRSFFVDILNFSEKVSPVFTPKEVFDASPLINPVK